MKQIFLVGLKKEVIIETIESSNDKDFELPF